LIYITSGDSRASGRRKGEKEFVFLWTGMNKISIQIYRGLVLQKLLALHRVIGIFYIYYYILGLAEQKPMSPK